MAAAAFATVQVVASQFVFSNPKPFARNAGSRPLASASASFASSSSYATFNRKT